MTVKLGLQDFNESDWPKVDFAEGPLEPLPGVESAVCAAIGGAAMYCHEKTPNALWTTAYKLEASLVGLKSGLLPVAEYSLLCHAFRIKSTLDTIMPTPSAYCYYEDSIQFHDGNKKQKPRDGILDLVFLDPQTEEVRYAFEWQNSGGNSSSGLWAYVRPDVRKLTYLPSLLTRFLLLDAKKGFARLRENVNESLKYFREAQLQHHDAMSVNFLRVLLLAQEGSCQGRLKAAAYQITNGSLNAGHPI